MTWILDRASSIWFAVTLLAIVFIYASIGSAIPPIRQGALADWLGIELLRFDKTEMEWFAWWPFQLQIGLFCLALILIAIRRLPATVADLGAWIIHGGIIILLISSAVYFGTKVEGDTVIFGSRALILAPGMTAPASMVVRPEASIQVGPPAGKVYQISVAQIMPDYEIRTGQEAGQKDQAIWFSVTSSDGRSFTRVVLAHHPEYTEDVISGPNGMQRAVTVTGEQLIDRDLQIQLDNDPVRYFYHAHRMPVASMGAVYARFSPADEWTQLRYRNLPYYYEHLTHRNELWQVPGQEMPPLRPLDLRPDQVVEGEVGKLDIRITDYLPYARLQSRWVDGGDSLNPVVSIQYVTPKAQDTAELVALSMERRRARLAGDITAELVWANSPEERDKYLAPGKPRIRLLVPSKNLQRELPIQELYGKTAPVPVEGTDYAVEVRELFPEGTISGMNAPAMALLRLNRAGKSFDRVVFSGDTSGGKDITPDMRATTQPADADLKIEYLDPMPERILLVGGPDDAVGLDVVASHRDGTWEPRQVKAGEPISLPGDVVLVVNAVMPRARNEIRPVIVPRQQRDSLQNAGKSFSLVRVEVNDGRRIESVWLPFNEYAFPDDQRAQPGRFTWQPRVVRLSDGRHLQLLYSRPRDPLPSAVALDRFIRRTYPGGDRESDYVSLLTFETRDGWSPLVEVRSNHPAQHGDLWYFQAQWDPGSQAHTVLGVGNRRAVNAMLAGVCISIFGMAYAFYVKPALRRRRRTQANGAANDLAEDAPVATEPEVTSA